MAKQASPGYKNESKERKLFENSPYSKNFKCYIKSDQRDLVYKRQMVTKLSRKELEDKYIDLCDENFFIKRQNNENLEKIKQLKARIIRLSDGHRSYSSTSILKENSVNQLDGRIRNSSKTLNRASSMSTIYKKPLGSGDKSMENSSRGTTGTRSRPESLKEEKGQSEESEKTVLMKNEVSGLQKKLEELNNDLRTERELNQRIEEAKHKLEAQLSKIDMHKFLTENIEINRLRSKFDDFRKIIKRLQEKNKKIVAQKDQELENERRRNREFQTQMKVDSSTDINLSDKVNELKSATRTIDILKKQISELEFDKKSLMEQQESLSILIKDAASCPKETKTNADTLLQNQELLETIEQLKTEKAAIENSKNEMFNKIRQLQDFNDKLIVELEGVKVEKCIQEENFIIINEDQNSVEISTSVQDDVKIC